MWWCFALALCCLARVASQDVDSTTNSTTSSAAPTLSPVIAPTGSPVASPTSAPVAAPVRRTRSPIATPPQPPPSQLFTIIPTDGPTVSPTQRPTGTLTDVEGLVYITLIEVADIMPDQYKEVFERQCSAYFDDRLKGLATPIRSNKCELLEQQLGSPESEGLLTLVKVDGKIPESSGLGSDINLVLRFAVINNPDAFVQSLKTAPDAGLYFESLTTVEASDPNSFNRPPTTAPLSEGSGDEDGDDVELTTELIIGIVIAIGAAAILSAGATYAIMSRGKPSAVGAASPSSREFKTTTLAQDDEESNRSSDPPSLKKPPRKHVLNARVEAASSLATEEEVPVDAPSSALESQGVDEMSYAYSLDAGNVDSSTGERLAGGGSTIGDQSTELSTRPNMIARTVTAPPGRLGIVIDTTLEGPVVHKVNEGSPLDGLVYPGDIIVSIGDVDTRAMSASAITALMVKTAGDERILTVLSEDNGAAGESSIS